MCPRDAQYILERYTAQPREIHRWVFHLYAPHNVHLKMEADQNFTPMLFHLIPHSKISHQLPRNQVLSHFQSISSFSSLCHSRVGSMPGSHYDASQMELMIIFCRISFVSILLSSSVFPSQNLDTRQKTLFFFALTISNFFFLCLSSCFSFCRI